MKKKVLFTVLITLLLSAAATVNVFAFERSSLDRSESYEKTAVTAYVFDKDNTTEFQCIFAHDLPVPYIDVEEYLDHVYTIDFQTESLSDGTYKISNNKGSMVVDPVNDTIHFDQFEKFLYNDFNESPDSIIQEIYTNVIGVEYPENAAPYDMDLKKYHIDIIEQEKKIYLPLSTISDIASMTYNAAVYADGEISINYAGSIPFVDWNIDQDPDVPRKENEIRYTYDELCFLMDHIYGCPSSCMLAESIENIGFDRTLEEYSEDTRTIKQLLNSEDIVDYMFGMWILTGMMYDGGHTNLYVYHLDQNRLPEVYNARKEVFDNPDDPRKILYDKYNDERNNRNNKMFEIENWVDGYDAYEPVFQESNGEYIFSYYEYDDTGIYVLSSLLNDGFKYLKRALDLAKEHGMKNFVLDVSYSFGGEIDLTTAILSIMGAENRLYFEGSQTHNKMEEILDFDLDQDGVFEQSDENSDYPFHFAVLCSRETFSCGNLLACRAKEIGIPVLGERSGGGTCSANFFRTPQGFLIYLSGWLKLTYKNGGDLENGAEPDYDLTKLTPDGKTDYSDFYNYELIDSILDKHYNKPTSVSPEERGDFTVTYAHEIPFFGNSTVKPDYFGGITVSYNNTDYKVSAIKVNKKKHLMQITALEGAGKKLTKAIKKATKGKKGLSFTTRPYIVGNTDDVKIKEEKDGSIESVKVRINGKYYKAKKNKEWSFDMETQTVSFFGNNLSGSFTLS